ncbi:MAG: HDOD domain-containing protein [Sulfuricurvum sp.]|nr:HDOD domain-containing protein [Sulfuricurvum sp.]
MLAAISSDLKISDLFRGDLQLTSPPNIYFELQQTIANPNKSITDVGFIIEQDPALSIRILKIVNSAFFGLPVPIASITRAVAIIGAQELQNLVLAAVVIDKFSSLPGGLLSMHDFWARSLRCALISKEICIYSNNKDNLDSMFICGLLHDIGQLVFYRRIPIIARQIGLLVEASDVDEIQAENNILGFNHYQTGAELARLWRLPEIIIETIGQHNHPDYTSAFADAASTVSAANYLCKMDAENTQANSFCNNIPADDLDDIINKAYNQFEVIFKLFY